MSKISEPLLLKAKDLYLDHKSVVEIERQTGISRDILNYHIHRKKDNWKNIKQGNKIAILESFTEDKKGQLVSISKSCIDIIDKALRALNKSEEITLKDAKLATDILSEMDKIVKLDDGEATSRTETVTHKPLTIEQLKHRLISSDPFLTDTEVLDEENSDAIYIDCVTDHDSPPKDN